MDDRGCGKTHWHRSSRFRRAVVLLVACSSACAGLSGCLGPGAIRHTRMRYNEVVRDTNDQQLLMNIVRLRYADSPVFIDLPSITSQFEVSAGASDPGRAGSQTNFGVAGLTGRDTPTLSYHPREGREIAKALLTPLSADLFLVVNAGADIEQLLLMTVNDINDVSNASRSTILAPKVPDDNTQFLQGIRLLKSLRDREATELAVDTRDESDISSDPIPASAVQGRDLIAAARDGYVFRARGEGRMTLLKQEKELFLQIRPAFVHSPEMDEVARIFHLKPGLSKYRIKSELNQEASDAVPSALGDDTIYLNMRSVLQIMTFLSKGVCIPEDHVRSGEAPITPGPNGRPFDWTRVTAGNFFVHSQKHRPHDTEVAVHYRGYWFYIATNDVNSRTMLAVLEILFALQESDGRSVAPLLTLPLGG